MTKKLQPPLHFELEESHARYCPVAEVTIEEAIELVDNALRYCRENEIRALLLDVRGLTGFAPPSVTDRFWFASQWAETAGGKVIMSMIAPPELILPDKIGITVAANRGLLSDVFTDEGEALKWLATCR